MNIFSYLKDSLSVEVVEAIASYVNENSDRVKQAADLAALSVVAGFLKRSSSESGAKALFKAIERENISPEKSAQLPQLLKDRDQISQIAQKGSNLFSHLLPDKRSVVITMITGQVKIRNSSATNVLGILSYLGVDILGKQIRDQNLDAVGLALLLRNQKDNLIKEVDPELFNRVAVTLSIEEFERLGYVTPAEEETVEVQERPRSRGNENPYADLTESSTFPWKSVVAGLGILAVLGGGYYAWQNYGDSIKASTSQDSTSLEEVAVPADSTALYPDTSAAAKPGVTPNTATSATSAAGGLADKLTKHLADPLGKPGAYFTFDEVSFDPITNQPTAQSTPALNALAEVMKKNPNLQLKFTGVTKQLGNKKNVFKQANSIKSFLTNAGVDIMRLDAASFLSSDSTKPNRSYIAVKVIRQ
ncbi:DUF937 domain-containing protein [Siphonobacter sp. SORGH_AS_0500]|uniref:DUF937 domain-containing protein n=1 Tax=Siphonobacter sp. SORGH_AS_0500 TaxID=1864824 RepID=UPI000CC6C23E|nr:DUF937 domain-containing protein [Siphonobacter sp. SORGH_AS_0500]MDR6195785.1 hypothetical protein [Siphonobacter sp. SORGH_AS_0500]PKK37483.1 hypothetical protein BWI96_06345 [Siphonobacter sp. SORGH_AS_0500]